MSEFTFNQLKQDFIAHRDNWQRVFEVRLGTYTDKAVREQLKRFMRSTEDGEYLEVLEESGTVIRVYRRKAVLND